METKFAVLAFNEENSAVDTVEMNVSAASPFDAARAVLKMVPEVNHAWVGARTFRRRSTGQVIEQ